MPPPTDEPNTNTLPDPELNPLVNPLLAAHMGRWAEVYFTAPPEKRDQAVAELIRELEANSAPEFVAPRASNEPVGVVRAEKEDDEEDISEILRPAEPAESVRSCSACGCANSAEQKFCGTCGAVINTLPVSHAPRDLETAPHEPSWNETWPAPRVNSALYSMNSAESASLAPRILESDESPWDRPEIPLPSFATEPEPSSYHYRLYAGVVLVILIGLLVYMAWRGTTAISSSSGQQPVPSKVIPPAPSATQDAVPQARVTPNESLTNRTPPSPPRQPQPEMAQRSRQVADSQSAPEMVTKAASSSASAPESSGADDLATAERFLNAGPGRGRDSREAALWLWKAVGKGNPSATIVLSDLYLRGDGVPKSCDEARLLLNAAARKGSKPAGERLRNLQAFGCE